MFFIFTLRVRTKKFKRVRGAGSLAGADRARGFLPPASALLPRKIRGADAAGRRELHEQSLRALVAPPHALRMPLNSYREGVQGSSSPILGLDGLYNAIRGARGSGKAWRRFPHRLVVEGVDPRRYRGVLIPPLIFAGRHDGAPQGGIGREQNIVHARI